MRIRSVIAGMLGISLIAACVSLYHLTVPREVLIPGCASPAMWAHRGYHVVAPENSIASVRAAIEKGFCGAEIDVQWFPDRGLVIAHDEIDENDILPNALTLSQLLDSLPRAPQYLWLDFKNLDRSNASAAAAHIDSLIVRHAFAKRFVVESVHAIPLRLLWWHAPQVIPAYWINRPAQGWKGPLHDAQIAAAIGLLGLPALSVPREMLTGHFVSLFGRLALFTWTCNSPGEIKRVRSLGARVVLTDGDFALLKTEAVR
jgi:Glycerophosphoryl diester phosphodiesterase family